jgi:spoIIIJ-associated protein
VEASARSVDEAIAQALQQLRLSREDVDVEVLHAGSPGRLLGFGAEPARVRVVPRSTSAASGDDQVATSATAGAAGVGAVEAGDEDADTEPIPENLEGEAELARLMLAELLNRMGIDDATVEVTGTDPMMLEVAGGDLADLIGRRGETLRSIQFILNLMLNKQLRRRIRVNVDVDGYRSRREDLLRNMAERFAHRVRTTGEAMQLETMPPNERRIIHMALADDPDVMSESVGEGESRRVVIRPRQWTQRRRAHR